MTYDAADYCTCDLGEMGTVLWMASGCPVHDCRPVRVPYVLDKDDPQVVEKAQANIDAATAHYAERERMLRERIEALPHTLTAMGPSDDIGANVAVVLRDVLAVFSPPDPYDEPVIGGPHEVANQYHSEPDRDPRQP